MVETSDSEKDLERNIINGDNQRAPAHTGEGRNFDDGCTPKSRTKEIQNRFAPLRYLIKGEEWLNDKLGIETQGVDIIKEEDKQPPHLINSFFMWWSMTCHVGTLPLGLLGPQIFSLSLGQSVAAIVVGTFLGALCTAYCGTLGPKVRISFLSRI